MNDICMVSPTLDKEKGSLEKQIETIERLTRTLNLSVENTQMFIFSLSLIHISEPTRPY